MVLMLLLVQFWVLCCFGFLLWWVDYAWVWCRGCLSDSACVYVFWLLWCGAFCWRCTLIRVVGGVILLVFACRVVCFASCI